MSDKNIIPVLLMVSLLFAGACNKVGFKKLDPIVSENLVVFNETEVPGQLQNLIETHGIILLGETYYVQEHQEYIARVLDLYGSEGLCFYNEFSSAYNWLLEDYIRGEIQHLPYYVRLLNQVWIEKIREINLAHGPDFPVKFYCMDVNHELMDFKNSIIESEKILGEQQLFALIKILRVDGDAYYNQLNTLKDLLEEEQESYRNTWGEMWYNRYLELIEWEIESYHFRTTGDEEVRENALFGYIQSKLEANPGIKALINCGINHAQRETLMGTPIIRIGGLLEENYPGNTCSLAFIGISGKRKYRLDDGESIDFNILETAAEDDIIRIMGEQAGNLMALLPMEDDIFLEEMDATYWAGAVRVSPGKQFDAIITYPEISILKSLSDFNF